MRDQIKKRKRKTKVAKASCLTPSSLLLQIFLALQREKTFFFLSIEFSFSFRLKWTKVEERMIVFHYHLMVEIIWEIMATATRILILNMGFMVSEKRKP